MGAALTLRSRLGGRVPNCVPLILVGFDSVFCRDVCEYIIVFLKFWLVINGESREQHDTSLGRVMVFIGVLSSVVGAGGGRVI